MLFHTSSREFRLIVQCCAPPVCGTVSTGLLQDVDWQRVLHLAKRHRVSGLVHRSLTGNPALPPDIRTALNAAAADIARTNLLFAANLARITRAMNAANLPFTVHKGLPLGLLAYDSLTLRHSKDLDLYVTPELLERTAACLHSLNFQRTDLAANLGSTEGEAYQTFRKHHEYLHPSSGMQIEVHWRESDNAYFSFPRAAPRAVDLLPGLQVMVPAQQDLLLGLCLHGAGHAWFRLKWLADVAALLANQGPDAAANLLHQARQYDLDRPVEQALLLCAELFPVLPMPGAHLGSRRGQWLARIAAEALLQEDITAPAADCAFVPRRLKRSLLFLRRSWRYRLQELRLHATSPKDWQTLPLPERAHFLYPLLRLPLWAVRRLRSSTTA